MPQYIPSVNECCGTEDPRCKVGVTEVDGGCWEDCAGTQVRTKRVIEYDADCVLIRNELQDCDGNVVDVSAMTKVECAKPVLLSSGPGTSCEHPLFVQQCNRREIDPQLLCDPGTGLPVAVIYEWSDEGELTLSYVDVTGSSWAGDPATLRACDTPETEADPIDWCVDGADYTQYVVKKNGVPTGEVVWTDPSGAIVPDPTATASAMVKGSCLAANQPIDIPLCEKKP